MKNDDAHRAFKDRLYGQFARIGKALASPHRLEILELLAQGERTVESLAGEIGLSLANASQHLQGLRQLGVLAPGSDGRSRPYRVARTSILGLLDCIRDHMNDGR